MRYVSFTLFLVGVLAAVANAVYQFTHTSDWISLTLGIVIPLAWIGRFCVDWKQASRDRTILNAAAHMMFGGI